MPIKGSLAYIFLKAKKLFSKTKSLEKNPETAVLILSKKIKRRDEEGQIKFL